MHTIIRLEGVRKDCRLGRVELPALRDVTVEFRAGEFAALRGRPAAGKQPC